MVDSPAAQDKLAEFCEVVVVRELTRCAEKYPKFNSVKTLGKTLTAAVKAYLQAACPY
jgi:hypothetical protein